MTSPADPTPADERALAEEAIRLANRVPWLAMRTNIERGNWSRYEKHLLLQAAEHAPTLARALLAALDEREARLADLPHALGRCGCEPIGSDYSSRLEMSVPTWPEAHTAAIARLEARLP